MDRDNLDKPTAGRGALIAACPVVTMDQPCGEMPSGLQNQPTGSREVRNDAPYAAYGPSTARMAPQLTQSPLYTNPPDSQEAGEQFGQSFANRLQPPIGWGYGNYVVNTAADAGAPREQPPEVALPGLRDGAYRFSVRLKALGDQGMIDSMLHQGMNYLDVNQPPYYGDDRPLGR